MRHLTKPNRKIVTHLAALMAALCVSAHTEPAMPATPEDVKAPPADAAKTASGLASIVLKAGSGEKKPAASDTVSVHYSGWTTDGKLFDSSVQRGEPASFPLNGVIKGWTEGLQLMTVGEKRRFWIPADLAYGENPGGGRPGGMLVFDVELLEIKEVAKVPEDAEKSPGGVAYKILQQGEGSGPASTDVMSFHMTASTMDGQTIQDTRSGPQVPSVTADKLPPPLAEMLTAMKAGEKRKCWISEANAPGGHVMVELELISFKEAPPPPPTPEDVAAVPAASRPKFSRQAAATKNLLPPTKFPSTTPAGPPMANSSIARCSAVNRPAFRSMA
jgi:FKBP-type peptidyl-prolyl cis-trans isomerase